MSFSEKVWVPSAGHLPGLPVPFLETSQSVAGGVCVIVFVYVLYFHHQVETRSEHETMAATFALVTEKERKKQATALCPLHTSSHDVGSLLLLSQLLDCNIHKST